MSKAIFNLQIENPSGEALRQIRNVIVGALPPESSVNLRISLAVDVDNITDTQALDARRWLNQALKDFVTQPASLTILPERGTDA